MVRIMNVGLLLRGDQDSEAELHCLTMQLVIACQFSKNRLNYESLR